MPNGFSVTQTSRKMNVSAASRIVSAISFGVFCRLRAFDQRDHAVEKTVRLVHRDANDDAVAESTRVPPVTALRSPPLSRMTGADSPVMADSSTLAMPSMTSPSAGMTSPAAHTTRSPFRRSRRGDFFHRGRLAQATRDGVLAGLAQRFGLRLAAAFGHGLGEVGEEHGEPEPDGELRDETAVGRGR